MLLNPILKSSHSTQLQICNSKRFFTHEGPVGDTISLNGTQDPNAYSKIHTKLHLNGIIPIVGTDFITGEHHLYKVDAVLYVDAPTNVPIVVIQWKLLVQLVQLLTNITNSSREIYKKDVNGTFPTTGSLFLTNGDFVGEYEKKLHNDASDYSHNGEDIAIDVGPSIILDQ